MTNENELAEELDNAGYVEHINEKCGGSYTWEQLKSMGCPTHVTPEGFISWE